MQAQAGETDMSAEPNVKAAINATEHAHSTPKPEKVHTLHKHVCKRSDIYSFIYISFYFESVVILLTPTYGDCGGGQRDGACFGGFFLTIFDKDYFMRAEKKQYFDTMICKMHFLDLYLGIQSGRSLRIENMDAQLDS